MKKIAIGILIILLGLITWYLFLKKYDYVITFKANLAPLGAYHKIKSIKTEGSKYLEMSNPDTNGAALRQEFAIHDQNVLLDWHFKSVTDTVTEIKVGILSSQHSLHNRLKILTGSSPLVTSVKEELIQIRKKLKYYTDTFRIIIDGEATTPAQDALIVSSITKRYDKAQEMMKSNGYLHPELLENNVDKTGHPFVKIKSWDITTDGIEMNFGFPIIYRDSLPIDSNIKYVKMNSEKTLKATYFGNYRNSDEAWFVLVEYANRNNIDIVKKPLEIFYDNPMQGGDELQWRAEIFLPLKDQ